MRGLVPRIHVFLLGTKDVDGRDERGHDVEGFVRLSRSLMVRSASHALSAVMPAFIAGIHVLLR